MGPTKAWDVASTNGIARVLSRLKMLPRLIGTSRVLLRVWMLPRLTSTTKVLLRLKTRYIVCVTEPRYGLPSDEEKLLTP